MINHNTTPNDILGYLKERDEGNDAMYKNCRKDTNTAISLLNTDLRNRKFKNVSAIFFWFIDNFDMHPNMKGRDELRTGVFNNGSFYRAFIILSNDLILQFRLSRHPSTENSADEGSLLNGKPNVLYQLVIERISSMSDSPILDKDKQIYSDMNIRYFQYNLADWAGDRRGNFIDELIGELKGNITENKQYNTNNMKNAKNKIKLTEGQLHRVIKESVKKILKEDKQSIYNTPEYQLLLKAFPEAGFTDEELNLLKQLYNKSNSGQNDMGEAILATLDALNFHTEAEELRNE